MQVVKRSGKREEVSFDKITARSETRFCQALGRVLEKHPGRRNGDVTGLALTFQKRLSQVIQTHWRLATRTEER